MVCKHDYALLSINQEIRIHYNSQRDYHQSIRFYCRKCLDEQIKNFHDWNKPSPPKWWDHEKPAFKHD